MCEDFQSVHIILTVVEGYFEDNFEMLIWTHSCSESMPMQPLSHMEAESQQQPICLPSTTNMATQLPSKGSFLRVVSYLETYRGRDKIVRLLNYGCYLIGGILKRTRGKDGDLRMGKFASELSNLRVMLRLFDDLSMLQYTLTYGNGSSCVCASSYLIVFHQFFHDL